ncbi:MAG: (Fe-S)-binding protein, partial [Crenarchaeota archaeon]|nr:(Fe-S)-binding protein [Thermoproteota archaeon]
AGLAAEAVGGLAYLYEDDLYSGVILYDLGLDEAFARHAEKVWARLRSRGVEEIVTLDPHTTHVMREVYPRYVDGYSLTVRSYLEALDEAGWSPGNVAGAGGRVVVHDPCLYARGLGVVEQPRRLLRRAGYEPVDPPRSRGDTYCCGGPVRAVAPGLSNAIAGERLEELASTGARVVAVMCPICFLNLSRAAAGRGDVELRDIAELLAAARG